jgi:very-short-patch-repair endonuclease
LARVVEEAEHQRHSDPLSLPALLDRHRGERGAGRLRAVLAASGYGMGVTRSTLEEVFAAFIAQQGLPHPELNAPLQIDGHFYEVDCLWRQSQVVVELHSATFHGATPAVTRDATRDRRLLLAGYRVIHVTWAQLHDAAERRALAADLRAVLGANR